MAETLAPAVQQALRDANRAFPGRKKASDGTWGDAAHKKRKSDHNHGDAVDITHDPASGADGNKIAEMATRDPRTKYVIWNRRIWTAEKPYWRPYTGKNPHDKHVHISVKRAARANTSPWAWANGGKAPTISSQPAAQPAAAPKAAPVPTPRPKPSTSVPVPQKRPATPSGGGSSGGGGKRIYTGEHTVVLGSKQLMAAHVGSKHTGGGKVAKGSRNVFVGPLMLPFARLTDPTTDNYNVITGKETIWIGG